MKNQLSIFKAPGCRRYLLMAMFAVLSFKAGAQTSRTYSTPVFNVKNYTISKQGASGTVYDPHTSLGSVHYMFLDPSGATMNSVHYDNGAQEDDRLVAQTELGNNTQLFTVSSYDPVNKMHFIRLINAQINGSFIQAADLKLDPMDGHEVFPTYSLVSNDTLFVCGYMKGVSATSDYTTGGTAFVLSYDLSGQTLLQAQYFGFGNTAFIPLTYGYANNEYYDYTMPLRMKLIDVPRSGRLLVVTGGANCYKAAPGFPSYFSQVVGGTMLVTFDPQTLSSNYHTSFASPAASFTNKNIEYGIDMQYDGVDKLYLLGNYAEMASNRDGYNPQPLTPFIQAVNFPWPTLPGGNDRTDLLTGETWGLQMDEDYNNPGTYTIAGMQQSPNPGCTVTPAPGSSNINPFLLNVQLLFSGGLTTFVNDWTTMPSANGTSSYNGYGINNTMAWAPRPMIQDGGLYKIMAPIKDHTLTGNINEKLVVADAARQLQDCPGVNSFTCNNIGTLANYAVSTNSTTTFFQSDMIIGAVPNTLIQDMPLAVTDLNCDNINYRTAQPNPGVSQVADAKSSLIYPNPATDHISLRLDGYAAGDKLSVTLMDQTGKLVGQLYTGSKEGMPASMALPSLATGLYLVTVEVNGVRVSKEKITILK